MKRCTGCRHVKGADEFNKRAASRDGLTSRCKTCLAVTARGQYERRREAGLTTPTPALRARARELAALNPGRIKEKNARQYAAHRERNIARAAAWRAANPERRKTAYGSWLARNVEHRLDLNHEYRSRRRTAHVDDVKRLVVFNRDGWVCQICHQDVDAQLTGHHPMAKSLDHVIPLSRGGDHSYQNVQLAHFGCNSSKGARLTVRG